MATLTFRHQPLPLAQGESVLECLERHGESVPNSCRSGVCQSCLMQATKGTVPPKSQQGLRDSWKERGLFLACQCSPEDDLTVAMPDEVVPSVKAKVHSFFMASESVLCLRLETETPFAYHPGQFINLQAPNGVTRPYSLASIPSESFLELHIRLIDNGEMSAWLRNSMAVGDSVTLRGPIGDCYYRGNPSEPLMLVGIGTGLAPLWGIVREALEKGHSAPIELIHSGCFVERLYYGKELRGLTSSYPQLTVRRCILEGNAPDCEQVDLVASLFQSRRNYDKHRVYLCGDESMVKSLKSKFFMAGVDLDRIHADPFVAAPSK